MSKRLAVLLSSLAACASGPERALVPPGASRAVAPSGPVQVGFGCWAGEQVVLVWNPSSTPRRCHLEDTGRPFEVEGLRLEGLDGMWPSEETVPRCEDAPVDVAARVATEVARLEDPEASVREEAAKAIAALGRGASSARAALAARVRVEDQDGPLYHAAMALIDLLGADAVEPLLDGIEGRTDPAGRARLAEFVVRLGEVAASGLRSRLTDPRVVEAFKTEDVVELDLEAGRRLMFERRAASGKLDTLALGAFLKRRPEDEEVAQVALEALSASSDPKERYRLVDVVRHLRSPTAVAALVGALGDSDRAVVYNAAGALGQLAQVAPSLISAEVAESVAALLPTGDTTLAWNATMTLGRIGRDTPRVRAALLAASASAEPRIRIIAAAARTQIGRERFGVGAMGRIPTESGPSDESVLREGIASNDSRIRGLALARVKELGPLAAPLVDAIAARLGEPGDDMFRDDLLAEVLLEVGPAGHEALREVASGRAKADLATWLEVVDTLGEAAASPILERLDEGDCTYRHERYGGVEAAVVRLRLGAASAVDRARVVHHLSQTFSENLARDLTPHARKLGLGEAERAAIAWLAEYHVDFQARRAIAAMWRELR